MRARIITRNLHLQRRDFTLLEIIAVIVIMMIGAGVASVYLRSGSSAASFDQAAREFKALASQARIQAMELGRDRVISFYPTSRTFRAGEPEQLERDEATVIVTEMPSALVTDNNSEQWTDPEKFAKLSWKLPDDYELDAESNLGTEYSSGDESSVEVFRFFPDGGGSGTHRFVMNFQGMKRVFTISGLTGLLIESNE